jgi:hypothetical protein
MLYDIVILFHFLYTMANFPVGEEHKINSWNGARNIIFTKLWRWTTSKVELKELASNFMQII